MTSEERHAARRQRREEKRRQKREADMIRYDDYDRILDANNLIAAAKKSKSGVAWKASVQKYFMSLLRNTWTLRKKLANEEPVTQGFISFDINERGKTRHIRSVHFKERVVQRSLCDNALVPGLSRALVYDNGASIKGKGLHFAIFRCKRHLQEYYREHGTNEGWILQIDFSKYFDSILHEPIRELLERTFNDKRICDLTMQFVDSFGDKSLGIGSQVSQILSVAYPGKIDHYICEVLRAHQWQRYADDTYIMHESREYLQNCLDALKEKYNALGITLNPRKTQIIPLRRFTFLKVRYELTATGKVILRPCRESLTKQRQKLKSFRKLYDEGKITREDIVVSAESWKGYRRHMNGYKGLRDIDRQYKELLQYATEKEREKSA